MRGQVKSSLLAGFIAATIWMAISVLVGMSTVAVVGGGASFLVGVTLVTAAISALIHRSMRQSRAT